jgi:hypothetical protein
MKLFFQGETGERAGDSLKHNHNVLLFIDGRRIFTIMRFVSPSYERQLQDLAEHLMRPIGDRALQDTVDFEPVSIEQPAPPALTGE